MSLNLKRRASKSFVAAIAAAATLLAAPGAAYAQPSIKEIRTLPTTRSGSFFVVQAQVDGQGPFALLLDTGTTASLFLSSAAARRIKGDHLFPPDAPPTAGRPLLITTRELSSGGVTLRAGRAMVMDMEAIKGFDGILGYGAFVGQLLILDGPTGEVRIAHGQLDPSAPNVLKLEPFELPAEAKALAQGGSQFLGTPSPQIKVKIGEREYICVVDSGSGAGFAIPSFDGVDLTAPPVELGTSLVLGAISIRTAARLRGDVRLANGVFIAPIIESTCGQATVGADVMAHYVTVFDQSAGLVQLTCADASPITMPPIRGIGALFEPVADGWRVRDVVADGPAEKAGLARGDVVVALDGRPPSDGPAKDRFKGEQVRLKLRGSSGEREVSVPVIDQVR